MASAACGVKARIGTAARVTWIRTLVRVPAPLDEAHTVSSPVSASAQIDRPGRRAGKLGGPAGGYGTGPRPAAAAGCTDQAAGPAGWPCGAERAAGACRG